MVFRLAAFGCAALLAGLLPGAAAAQHITIAGGPGGARALAGPNYLIGANLGKQVGGNLFDSFSSFNLAAGQRATFTGPTTVDNIIAGVTGGNPSTIDGTIRSAIRGANLFLINPDGIVFGPQAKVNVGGGFYASTADYLKLGRDGRFAVTHPGGSRLSAAPPAAFGFLTARPAAITVNGSQLGTVPGTLGLIGGPLTVRNGASAQAGGIHFTAAADKGLVPVNPRRKTALTVKHFGRAAITGGSLLETVIAGRGKPGLVAVTAGRLVVSGAAQLLSIAGGSGRGAPIFVSARSILIDQGAIIVSLAEGGGTGGSVGFAAGKLRILSGGTIGSSTNGQGNAGNVRVTARRLQLADFGRIASKTAGPGNGGNVSVNGTGAGAAALVIRANGEIAVGTFGAGNGGLIAVAVSGRLTINGAGADPRFVTGIAAQANAGSTGNAGDVSVMARNLRITRFRKVPSVRDGVLSNSAGAGNAGNVRITARGLQLADFGTIASDTAGTGNGGNGQISAATFGAGNGGQISVDVKGGLVIDGAGADPSPATGIVAGAGPGSTGNAGNVRVTARRLRLADYGTITSNTFGPGNGGQIAIDVKGGLVIYGASSRFASGISTLAFSTGNAGDVRVTARRLRLADHGTITSSTFRAGNGGNVSVEVTGGGARTLAMRTNSQIAAGTLGAGNGGQVSVDVKGGLVIDGGGGNPGLVTGIVADADPGSTGNAGNVRVTARRLRLADNGTITSSTYGTGNGGNVSVEVTGGGARTLAMRTNGQIAAGTIGAGNGGQVSVDVKGGLVIDGAGANRNFAFATGIAADADPGSTGNAGSVTVSAPQITLRDGAAIVSRTAGSGAGGSVDVTASGALRLDGAGNAATQIAASATGPQSGAGGIVTVAAGTLIVKGGAEIASTTAGTGAGGDIRVQIAGKAALSGAASDGTRSGIAASADPGSSGKAGTVIVTGGTITISAGAQIASTTEGTGAGGSVTVTARGALLLTGNPATQIAASAGGPQSGPGGNVSVAAGSLMVEGGAEIASSTAGTGTGGNIAVNARSEIVLSGPGPQITALSTGSGNAGSVTVAANRLLMSDGATISTEAMTSTASGGDIGLSVGALLDLVGSEITTSVMGQTGNGGNINIAAGLAVLDHSSIIAQAVAGNGGNITINKYGGTFVASAPPDSTVSASSQKGISGVVEINGITPLNGALVALSSELRRAVALTADTCAARARRPQSSLVEAGRGGLPQDPDASLPALYIAGRDVRIEPRPVPTRARANGEPNSALRVAMRCGLN
jgi:filamentous hemagglutinin family protein